MKAKIGISEEHLENNRKLLSVVLADEMVMYIKTRKFHWNVYGESFMEIHKLLQSQYTELEEVIDTIAERINKLGGNTIGTMTEYLKYTRLKEGVGLYPNQKEMMKELLEDHESLITLLRKDIELCGEKNKDAGSTDMLTGIIQQQETMAWIWRRYLN